MEIPQDNTLENSGKQNPKMGFKSPSEQGENLVDQTGFSLREPQAFRGLDNGQAGPAAGVRHRRVHATRRQPEYFGALLVGYYNSGGLQFAGRVGTGFLIGMRIVDQCAASSGEGVAAFAGFFRPHSAKPWTKT